MLENLEEDATNIPQFIASKGLMVNPSKTEFMLLNNKDTTAEIQETESVKLFGIRMDNGQKWTSHF